MGQSFEMLRRKGQDPNQSAFYDYGTRGGQASNSNDKHVEKLLKGLKQVSADEKAADDVMVGLWLSPSDLAGRAHRRHGRHQAASARESSRGCER